MFWFNEAKIQVAWTVTSFKYILCFGSTLYYARKANLKLGFKYILCFGSTSSGLDIGNPSIKFKYILCFGSTEIPLNIMG